MSRFTITTKEAGQSQVFNLKAVASAEDIIAVPAIQTGYYLIEGGEGNQLSEGLSLSRHHDALHIHVDESAAPSAIIPGYYSSPALLTIPASNNQLQALDMAQVQTEHAPVALSLLAGEADAPYTPGAPGVIVPDSATDDSVDGSPKEIDNHEGTADLTPELHGTAFGAEQMVLTIYANTQEMGTVIVADDGTWSFTPDEGMLSYGSNYIFQVVLQDSSSSLLFIAMPFTLSESADGQPAADLPNTGDDGLVLIDHLVDDNGIHQGDVANNGVTDDLNPVIQGTLFGGEEMIVKIFANTEYLGTTVVNEDGTWSFDLSGLENHAQYTIEAILQDSSSDAKFISLPFVFTTGFDEQVPVITSVHDDAGKVTGDLADGQPTDDTTPTINGTADPDAIVNIYDGTTLLGSAQADDSGVWSFTPETPLSGDGDHHISATATDGTDESANSGEFNVNLDTVCEKPVITDIEDDVGNKKGNILDNGNITDDGNVLISGTSEPGSSLTLYFTGVDNVIESLELTPNADGTWSIPSDYMEQKGDGTYSYWLTSVDAAGNQGTSDIVTVTYKTAPPDASTNEQLSDDVDPKTGPILNGDTTDDSTPTYQGDAEPKDVVIISDNGKVIGSTVADDKGHWSFTPDTPLDDGDHSFSTVVVDGNGNQSDPSAPIGFTVDTSVPDTIDITNPDNLEVYDDIAPITGDIPQDGITNDTMPTFSGTTPTLANGDIVTIYSDGEVLGSAVVGDGGAWNFTPSSPMAEGPHEIELTVTNAAGAESDKSLPFDFTIDTIAPQAPVITDVVDDSAAQPVDVAQNGATSDTTPVIKGTGDAEGDIITVSNNGTVLGSAVVGADGTWSFTPATGLADGQYDITVTETDAAGNVSDPSAAYDFTIDTVAPGAPTLTEIDDNVGAQTGPIAQDGTTDDSAPVFKGTGENDGDIITIYGNGDVIGSAVVTDGQWTFTPAAALADGQYDITVTETDAAGNESVPTAPFDFTISTNVPDAATGVDVRDDEGDEQGIVVPGGATDDTTPVIEGDATPGDVVIISDNGVVIGSTTVDPDGTWNFVPDAPLDTGSHSIDTVVVDPATGAKSAPSEPVDFSVISKGSTSFENVTGIKNLLSDTPFTNGDKGLGGLSVTLLKPGYEATGNESEIGTKGVALFAPKTFGKVDMELSGNSQTRLDFGGQTNMVSFDVAAVTAPGTVVHYFDINGKELGHVDVATTDPDDTRAVENISWEAPAGSLISYVEIDVGPETSSGTIRVDNITWGETQYEAVATQAEATHSDVSLMALAAQAQPVQHDGETATASTHDAPQNHLTLSLDDVLSQGADNAFIADGKAQFAVTGEAGEHVDLTGVSDSSLAHTGEITSGGIAYDVYSVAGSDTELLVQHGLELHAMA
ncbi:Ig-like domain-containing protein [Scandinavium goeteborgense]|uniref:Bacterial Ig-like domain-containing protein n=1 Tax=Scandinavium goeteborgense TaxID=1851514 RepID=A0A4R6DR07_SCAGO|nr:Ig-like domain-containing protein [Scandinavium goeteborgense]TDN47446.1 hypothetical protein EC847_13213 [Scandinavium goeteborgense]